MKRTIFSYIAVSIVLSVLLGKVDCFSQERPDSLSYDTSDLLFAPDSLHSEDSLDIVPKDVMHSDHSYLVIPSSETPLSVSDENLSSDGPYRLVMDGNGDKWRMYRVDGLILGVNVRKYKDFGRWFRVDYYILNEGNSPKRFDFSSASVISPDGRAKLFTHDEFIRKSRRRRFWSSFGTNVAILTTGVILDEVVNGEYFGGRADEYSFGRDIAHEASSFFISELSFAGMAAASAYFSGDMSRVYSENLGYVRDYTIKPDTAIEGHAYARYSPSGVITVNVPVGGRVYSMDWDTSKIESLSKGEL